MRPHLVSGIVLAAGLAVSAAPAAAQEAAAAGGAQTRTEPAPPAAPAAASSQPQQPEQEPPPQADEGSKLTPVPGGKALGMSILGNQEAPTSLVIVPWKTSELGGSPGIAPMLDDATQPVDKDVFMRSLRYYEIRSGKTP